MTAEGTAWLVLIGAVWLAGYAAVCWLYPFGACRKCKGNPRRRSPSKKYWRFCKKCGGTGQRVRLGRRVLNKLRS